MKNLISLLFSILVIYFSTMWIFCSRLLFEEGISWALQNTTIKELNESGTKMKIIILHSDSLNIEAIDLPNVPIIYLVELDKKYFTKDGSDLIINIENNVIFSGLHLNLLSEGEGSNYFKRTYIWFFFTWINWSCYLFV